MGAFQHIFKTFHLKIEIKEIPASFHPGNKVLPSHPENLRLRKFDVVYKHSKPIGHRYFLP